MLIGIIGAGIAGLTAGRRLAQAGHEVIVFEKSQGFGGRLATRYFGEEQQIKMDHGVSSFTADDSGFTTFVDELVQKGLLKEWGDTVSYYNGSAFYSEHPAREPEPRYIAPKGMNSIAKYMSRWVDFYQGETVGGITYIGRNPQKKRSWMINLATINVFEVDAVIVATPATQAYGIIQTAQDETPVREIIREIDDIRYSHSWSLMAGYEGEHKPDWRGVAFTNSHLEWMCNESSKRENDGETTLVMQSTNKFANTHQHSDPEVIVPEMLKAAAPVAGDWVRSPKWHDLHYWRFARAVNPLDRPYMEFDLNGAPLALIGDYFQGSSVESSWLSGNKLAEEWIRKYSPQKVPAGA